MKLDNKQTLKVMYETFLTSFKCGKGTSISAKCNIARRLVQFPELLKEIVFDITTVFVCVCVISFQPPNPLLEAFTRLDEHDII
jgi:hypothetical protein